MMINKYMIMNFAFETWDVSAHVMSAVFMRIDTHGWFYNETQMLCYFEKHKDYINGINGLNDIYLNELSFFFIVWVWWKS